jgi:hypothetical protein
VRGFFVKAYIFNNFFITFPPKAVQRVFNNMVCQQGITSPLGEKVHPLGDSLPLGAK